jgi:transglutaminase-like putative cysteine protease
MSKYRIKHITRYTYPSSVIDSANQVMLFPLNDAQQEVKKHEILISHQPSVEIFTDYFGNQVGVFSVIRPHAELTIQSTIDIVTEEVQLPADDTSAELQWENLNAAPEQAPFLDFLALAKFNAFTALEAVTSLMKKESTTPFEVSKLLSAYVYDNFEYKKGITNVETKVDEIWNLKAGVCQDFAHILLVMLRIIGIPARYVSGYICPKNHELRGEGATHAWVEAYIPFYGWIGLDPTNNCIVSDRHVRLAIGRNFSDCTPVKGTYKGSSEHILEVSVTIDNGTPKNEDENLTPVFTYQVQNPGVPDNSYRRFMEMQQQQ